MREPPTTSPPEELLPRSYDKLVSVERLQHGEYNPRQVRPKDELISSIKSNGLRRPLIVRPATDSNRYHITDGWQRYQAAVQAGWEQLPVNVYSTALEALEAAETESIVREWSIYDWANHCQAVATEITASSHKERAQRVAKRVNKEWRTVARYLAVLELPKEVHPLLTDGPEGSMQAWAALENFNARVKEYGSLSWIVAEPLGRAYRRDKIPAQRAIGLAAKAVSYDRETAADLINRGIEQSDEPLTTVEQFARQYADGSQNLRVPPSTVSMSESKRRAIMRYCGETHQSITTVVEELLDVFAESLIDNNEEENSHQQAGVKQSLFGSEHNVDKCLSVLDEADHTIRCEGVQATTSWTDTAGRERRYDQQDE